MCCHFIIDTRRWKLTNSWLKEVVKTKPLALKLILQIEWKNAKIFEKTVKTVTHFWKAILNATEPMWHCKCSPLSFDTISYGTYMAMFSTNPFSIYFPTFRVLLHSLSWNCFTSIKSKKKSHKKSLKKSHNLHNFNRNQHIKQYNNTILQ